MPCATKPLEKSLGKRRPQRVAAPSPQELPERYARVILHLEDGTQVRGVWTGSKWWAAGGIVHPVRWEQSDTLRKRPTEKKKAAKKKK